jgi:hypothetical protein
MKITVGEVVAGAAVAAGAVLLLGAASEQGVGGVFGKIGDWISGLFHGGESNSLGEWISTHQQTAQAIGGAALLGGGYKLHRAMQDKKQLAHDQEMMEAANHPVEGGYAEQIAVDRAMMRARAAMVQQTPEFAGMMRG